MFTEQQSPIVVVLASGEEAHKVHQAVIDAVHARFAAQLYGTPVRVIGSKPNTTWWFNPLSDDSLVHLARLRRDDSLAQLETWVDQLNPDEFADLARSQIIDQFQYYGAPDDWMDSVKMIVTAGDFNHPTEYAKRALHGLFPNARWVQFTPAPKYVADMSEDELNGLRLEPMHESYPGEPKTELDGIDTGDLGLGYGITDPLHLAGMDTLADLIKRSEAELLAVIGIGPVALNKIKQMLEERGLALRQD